MSEEQKKEFLAKLKEAQMARRTDIEEAHIKADSYAASGVANMLSK